MRTQVNKILSSPINSKSSPTTFGEATIFEELRDSPKLPSSEKSLRRLTDEGNVLLIAATETPAKVMALITYHLLANPPYLKRLKDDIQGITDHTLATLESLPFLSACIKEGLRLHGGIVARSQRISPNMPMQYKQWTIPPGTPISCASIFMHYNPSIFPEPQDFNPERWLQPNGGSKQMEKYFVAFGRGTRNCLGYNLGLAELYLGLDGIFTKFDMELYETGLRDVELERDWFIPQPAANSEGVRVIIRT